MTINKELCTPSTVGFLFLGRGGLGLEGDGKLKNEEFLCGLIGICKSLLLQSV